MSTLQKGNSEERSNLFGVVKTYHRVTFGASSAVSSQSSGTGVSFANGSTGVFTVTLTPTWQDFCGLNVTQVGGTLDGGTWEVSTDLSGNTIGLTHLDQDGTPAAGHPAAAAYIFEFTFQNKNVGPVLG